MSNAQRTMNVKQLLDDRIASEKAAARGPWTASLALFSVSLTPLIALATCVFWAGAGQHTPSVATVMTVGCLSLTFTIWQFGSRFAKQSEIARQRVHQLEDLQIYLVSVPEKEWPAKEMLKVVLTGRHHWPASTAIDFTDRATDCE
jgi:hypothetical protein